MHALLYTCLLIAGVFQARAQSFDILKKTPPKDRFKKAHDIFSDDYWHKDSVTAFNALAQLNLLATQLHDKSLGMDVYIFKADWYSIDYHYNVHSLYYYDKAIGLARGYDLSYEEGFYTYCKAVYYKVNNRYVQACQCYLKAYDIFNGIGFNNVPDVSDFLNDVSKFYYSLGDLETAKRFLLEALNNKPSHGTEVNMTNTIGMIYRSTSDYDKALLYFNKAFSIAKKYDDSVWMGIATGNIGSVYFLEGYYDQALPYIKTDYIQSVKYVQRDNAAFALLRLATINVKQGNFQTAEIQLDTVANLIKYPAFVYLDQHIAMYSLWAEIAEKTGRPLLAFEYQKKYAAVKDSLTQRDNVLAVERIKLKWEMDKNQARIDKLNARAKAEAIMRNSLAGILFLLIVIAFLLYNRQKMIVKRNEAALQLEKAQVQQERDAARLALVDYTDKLRQQNDLVESFKAEMDHMQRETDPLYQARVAEMEQMMKAHIMTDKAWKEFKSLFDKVHPHFFTVINNRFQNLTDADIRLLALMKLRLNNTEMAGMLGITTEGVRKSKQRLRKRAALHEESSLEEVVAGI